MTEEEMEIAGIYRDENGRYHRRPRSKEDQERFDELIRIRDKGEEEFNNLVNKNPTQQDMENFSKFLHEQNQKRPDFTEVNKLIKEWRTKMG